MNTIPIERTIIVEKNAYLRKEKGANERKQHFLTIIFSLTCMFFLTLFGALSFLKGNIPLATVCLAGSLINVGNLLFLRSTGRYQEACLIIVGLMSLLTIYLVCSGGSNNTGPLWFYVMPVLIFYVLELRLGLLVLIILEITLTLILVIPNNPILATSYDPDFISRFLASVVAVTILAFAYEYTRQDWQQEVLGLNEQLEKLSRTDELTGLTNRRDMKERLEEEIARFKQNHHPFALILGDIDHFKEVNDQYGHSCGDEVLRKLGQVLLDSTKEQDRVSRWGGEEFLILMPETGIDAAKKVAERLRRIIEKTEHPLEEHSIRITMSFGVAQYDGSESLASCIEKADRMMYLSKQTGRNRVS